MLEIHPGRERRKVDLSPDFEAAVIRAFGRTSCPDCGGEPVRRLAGMLAKYPVSTGRAFETEGCR